MPNVEWLNSPIPKVNASALAKAEEHQNQLTKPPGSLGTLESIVTRLSAMQESNKPNVNDVHITIFAADHGIADEGVSAFPQDVTVEMIRNFANGGAAINVLSQQINAKLEVVNLGTVRPTDELPNVITIAIAPGTANFSIQPAMGRIQLKQALEQGRESILRAIDSRARLFIGGEMGIANTTSAAALACALLGEIPEMLAGPGTGLDKTGVKHKASVISKALEKHQGYEDDPIEALRIFGGFEIAALVGAYISAAQAKIPSLVDGFISSIAALCAVKIAPDVREWMFFSHTSAEPGHQRILDALQAEAILSLGMRLGEGSSAATAVPLMRLACSLHNEMATFASAQVSEKKDSADKPNTDTTATSNNKTSKTKKPKSTKTTTKTTEAL